MDDALALIVVMASGNPVVTRLGAEILYPGLMVVLGVVGLTRRYALRPRRSDWLPIAAFVAVSGIHLIEFGSDIASAVVGFLVKLAVGWLCACVIHDLRRRYISVIYGLACISLSIFSLQHALNVVGFDLRAYAARWSMMDSYYVHIGIHNFHLPWETYRNSGVFWEPGAFAGYIVVAIVLLASDQSGRHQHRYRKNLVVLVVALLTTQSTTGYVVAPLALALHLPGLRDAVLTPRGVLVALTGGLGIALVSYVMWLSLPYLSEKVSEQYWTTTMRGTGWQLSRMGNLIDDLTFLRERPITGWSAHPMTRGAWYYFQSELVAGQGNGLSGFGVRFGLAGLVTFLIATYQAARRTFAKHGLAAVLATSAFILILNGEQFLDYPLFLSLMFLRPYVAPAPGQALMDPAARRATDAHTEMLRGS